jgi:peptidoglycan-associated lipoprotein
MRGLLCRPRAKAQSPPRLSLGKEKPKAAGHDEAAWAQNRRVDLAYPNK